ncbi:hypothetical protein [Brucella intermedia]|uniref:hypothetical protein n=1 Tax=Brucella intermedia TaxID=94625 RepID=UPI00158A5985|nr:hypothetical protein [Brucella intermedia]NYD84401.1 hypothetical protein [Brucella intermedia]
MTIVISEEAVNIALNTWLGGVPAWCNDETERLRTEMRAALTAALPHLPQGVGVKKLEWQQDGAGNHRAETPFGNEFVQKWTDIRDGNISYEHEGAYFETVEAAKAAAQADYEARILSALEPSAARKLALEEIRSFNPREEVEAYEFRGDNGDYTPSEAEKVMLEDFAAGLLGRVQDAVFSRTPGGSTNDE